VAKSALVDKGVADMDVDGGGSSMSSMELSEVNDEEVLTLGDGLFKIGQTRRKYRPKTPYGEGAG
jgi:hypothetical protein